VTVALPPADAAARRAAQLEFDRPVVLEAGAGTGKTTALVARLLAWSVGLGWERTREELEAGARSLAGPDEVAKTLLERVVAITFTEAAAAEMAERFQRELARLGDARDPESGGPPWPPSWLVPEAFPPSREERALRARALLAAVDRLRVQTIHSFALRLVRRHALDLLLHPSLSVDAEETVLDETLHATLTELLPPRYRAGDPALERLAHRGIGPREIAAAAKALAQFGVGAEPLERDPFDEASIRSAVAPLAANVMRLLERLQAHAFPKQLTGAESLRGDLALLAERLDPLPGDRAALTRLLEVLDDLPGKSGRNKLDNWRRGKLAKGEVDLFGAEADEVIAASVALDGDLAFVASLDPDLLDAARTTVAPLLRETERRLRARGVVTFADLLRFAVQLLGQKKARPAAARIRAGIRQLLVDEFQDTDELQAILVLRLALEGPPEDRPGLFLVGDPKQSIYGWRRARLGVYRELVGEALGGAAPLPLTANFRSASGILDEVERAVAPLMTRESETEARFEPLVALGERRDERARIEYWLTWPSAQERDAGTERLAAAEAARREAAAIAADLAERIARGALEPARAALLVRGKTHVETYLDALRERDVAFAVEKDRSYFRRRETIDAAALVRAILDPADLVALTTLLRSPFVGVPDAALLPLFRAGLPERLGTAIRADAATRADLDRILAKAAATMPSDVPGLERVAGWPTALEAALVALLERRAAFAHEDAQLWVDRLREAFAVEPVAAARYQAPYRLANLDRFFRELGARLVAGEAPHRIVADLRRTVAEGADTSEARPLASADDAVRVMTLHAAKGLEFDDVYLVGVHQRTGVRRAAPGNAAEYVGEAWEYRLFGVPTPGLAPVRDLDERIRAAEQVRLLYVGMTRAIRRLVLVGALPGGGPVPPERAGSLADLLAGRLPATEELPARLAAAGASGFEDETQTLWRLTPPSRPSDRPTDEIAGDAAIDGAHDDLLALRARERGLAEARQRRRRHAPTTALVVDDTAEASDDRLTTPRAAPARDEVREEALARGQALHLALELAPIARREPERWRAAARSAFERALPGAGEAERRRFEERLDRLAGSELFARLEALSASVVARELPILLAAESVDDGVVPETPIDAITGAIDLLYLDPSNGEPVIADFKSDAVEDDEAEAALRSRYAPQLAVYAEAVRRGLGLDRTPRRELWSLALDRILPLDEDPVAR